jgi:hypothetical protein
VVFTIMAFRHQPLRHSFLVVCLAVVFIPQVISQVRLVRVEISLVAGAGLQQASDWPAPPVPGLLKALQQACEQVSRPTRRVTLPAGLATKE